MRLLLDTHVLLWAASAPATLTRDARSAIEDGANEVFVSVASAWEIALKQSVEKLTLPRPAERWVPEVLRRYGFEVADIELDAALRVRALPMHHRDPFDRLLIAQALSKGFTVVSRDRAFAAYGVPILPA